MADFQFVLLLFIQKISWFLTCCNISQCPPKKKTTKQTKKKKPHTHKKTHRKKERKKNPVRVGVRVFPFWPWHFQMKHT